MVTEVVGSDVYTVVGVDAPVVVPEATRTETLAPSSGLRVVSLHVDGSATPNPGAVVVSWATGPGRVTTKSLHGTHSNNYAEIAAVGCGLARLHNSLLGWKKNPTNYHVRLYSDSQTVRAWMNGSIPGEEVQERQAIIQMIARLNVRLMRAFGKVTILPVGRDRNWAHPNGK